MKAAVRDAVVSGCGQHVVPATSTTGSAPGKDLCTLHDEIAFAGRRSLLRTRQRKGSVCTAPADNNILTAVDFIDRRRALGTTRNWRGPEDSARVAVVSADLMLDRCRKHQAAGRNCKVRFHSMNAQDAEIVACRRN